MRLNDTQVGGGRAKGAVTAVNTNSNNGWTVRYPRGLEKMAEKESPFFLLHGMYLLSFLILLSMHAGFGMNLPISNPHRKQRSARLLPYFGKWVRIRVRFSSGSLSFSCLACSRSCRLITVKTERSSVLPNTCVVSYRGRLSQNCGTLQ